MSIKRVGLIGVGLMGHGIGKNILARGFDRTVMGHRNRAPVDGLVSRGPKERSTVAVMADNLGYGKRFVPRLIDITMKINGLTP